MYYISRIFKLLAKNHFEELMIVFILIDFDYHCIDRRINDKLIVNYDIVNKQLIKLYYEENCK